MRAARLLLLLAPLHAQQRRTINDVVSTRPKYSINDVVSRKRSTGRPRVGIRVPSNSPGLSLCLGGGIRFPHDARAKASSR